MRRREFMAGIGSAAAWPVVARAQQRPIPVIGWLAGRLAAAPDAVDYLAAFRQRLGQYDRLPALLTEFAHRHLFLSHQGLCHLKCAVDDKLSGRVGRAILECDNHDWKQLNRRYLDRQHFDGKMLSAEV